jgi:hypothetical protein
LLDDVGIHGDAETVSIAVDDVTDELAVPDWVFVTTTS